jgi:DNA-binding NarL/FixJ family response regulator
MAAVAIYSADRELRRRLDDLLRKEPDLTIVGVAEDPAALLKFLDAGEIDAVVTDAVATDAPPNGGSLTPRELEVLAAMADGASNKAIARRLGISFHTAKFHVAAILAKLDADSRTEAVARAAHLGLVML